MHDHRDTRAGEKATRDEPSTDSAEFNHARALETVARQFGQETWNMLAAKIGLEGATSFMPAVPIVRIFDLDKARAFYLAFLGMAVDWQHRFGENYPLYMQVSRGGWKLHLSEHAGDATPGGNMVVYVNGLKAFHAELSDRATRDTRLWLEKLEWGLEMQVTDPFDNRIRFIEQG